MSEKPFFMSNKLAHAFWENEFVPECPVYDMHGHMGENNAITFPIASTEDMVVHLRRIHAKLVFCHHWALFTPEFTNGECYEIVKRYPDVFRIYIAVNPHYSEIMRHDLAMYDSWKPLAVGFKILADYHQVKVSDPRYAPVLERADDEKALVLFHTWGGSSFDGPDELRKVVKKYRNIRYILGHAFCGMWEDAVQLVREYPDNVYLELTSLPGRAGVIETLVRGAGSERILFGTDLPWFDEYQAVGGIVGAKISEDDMHNILHRNAQQLLPGF